MSPTTHLNICGSFGFGNAGDEAVPEAITDLGNSLGYNLNVNILTRYEHPDLKNVIGLGDADTLSRTALQGNPLIFSGGGIIEPRPESVLFRCKALASQDFSSKAALFGCSVEPLVAYSFLQRLSLNRIFKRLTKLYVRDILSAETLKQIAPKQTVEVIGDTVLWLKAAQTLPKEVESLERYITVSLAPRWKNSPGFYRWLADELIELTQNLQASIVFVPCSVLHDDDRPEHHRLAKEISKTNPHLNLVHIDRTIGAREICAVYQRSLLTIGMRLHACVMTYAQKTPFVELAYHPKLLGFIRTIGWENQMLVPVSPKQQEMHKQYGFRFEDLAIESGQLVTTAHHVLEHSDFSKLPQLKQRQKEALLEFLE